MTKEEFTNQFNTLISAPTLDHSALAAFRAQVEADYDTSTASQTTLTTAQQTIKDLQDSNAALKDANLRLFMMNPTANPRDDNTDGKSGKSGKDDPSPSGKEDLEDTKETSMDLGAVIDALVGKINNK